MVVDEPTSKLLNLFQQEYYELRFDMTAEEATPHLAKLPMTNQTITGEEGQTRLTGALADDGTIYNLLAGLAEKDIPPHLCKAGSAEP